MGSKTTDERLTDLENGFARVLEHGTTDEGLRALLEQQDAAIAAVWSIQTYVVAAVALIGLLAASVLIGRVFR